MRLRSTFLALSLFLMSWSGPARADSSGYVCFVAYVPVNGPAGKFGHVRVEYRSQPWCGGNRVAFRTYCSLDATSTDCPGSNFYVQQTQESILALAHQLQDAATAGSEVREFTVGTDKGFYVGIYAPKPTTATP